MVVGIILFIIVVTLGIVLHNISILNANQKTLKKTLDIINTNLTELDKTVKLSQLGLSTQIKELNSKSKANSDVLHKVANKTGAW